MPNSSVVKWNENASEGAELPSHGLRQVVRDGQLAQLDEPPRLDEAERCMVPNDATETLKRLGLTCAKKILPYFCSEF